MHDNKKIPGFSSNGGVLSVCRFCHSALQSFKCVCGAWTHVCIHKGHFPSSPPSVQLFYLHCTLVWLFIRKTCLLSSPHPPSWLWLVATMVQIMPGLHHITDTHKVREYPDSTISKVLTVLKWWMITTFNRKLLEKQSVKNCFASYEVHIHVGHFCY